LPWPDKEGEHPGKDQDAGEDERPGPEEARPDNGEQEQDRGAVSSPIHGKVTSDEAKNDPDQEKRRGSPSIDKLLLRRCDGCLIRKGRLRRFPNLGDPLIQFGPVQEMDGAEHEGQNAGSDGAKERKNQHKDAHDDTSREAVQESQVDHEHEARSYPDPGSWTMISFLSDSANRAGCDDYGERTGERRVLARWYSSPPGRRFRPVATAPAG
jgi:hypothetical protein